MNDNFTKSVIRIVSKIPKGQTLSYKEVAKLAGSPNAYRAVGNILNQNFKKGKNHIPCHRVIRSDGNYGGYAKGNKIKIKLLNEEFKCLL